MTTEPLTEEYLAEVEARCAAATEGPWVECRHLESVEADAACGCGYRGGIFGLEFDPSYMVCEMGSTLIPGEEGLEAPRYPRPLEIANARFIAHARTDVPKLLAEIRRLKAQLASAGKDGIAAGILIGAVAREISEGAGFLED